VVCDPKLIKQVVRNLISNAVKFTNENGVITVLLQEKNASFTTSIINQGVGIPEDELEAIFNKFFQSSQTKNGAGGTGLGLSICREIINKHQGRLWAEDLLEGGSKFSFTVPIEPQVVDDSMDPILVENEGNPLEQLI
jgi:signal transduction histidine kinase